MTRLRFFGIVAAVALGFAGAGAVVATPLFLRGGTGAAGGGGGGGTAYALGTGALRADFAAGQAYITWPGPLDGSSLADYSKRHRVYRTNALATDLASCTGGTLVAKYIMPNSGQSFGGDPDDFSDHSFTQAHRQSTNLTAFPMAKIPDMNLGGTRQLSYGDELQVYTATGTATGNYCAVQTDANDGSLTYVGAVGPIAESVAAPQAIQIVHHTTGCNRFTGSVDGNPIAVNLHASSGGGGPAFNSSAGDYYGWYGDATQGLQDGRATAFTVREDGTGGCSASYASWGTSNSILYANRDTNWNTLGTSSIETDHLGLGGSPPGRTANRHYKTTINQIAANLRWIAGNYSPTLSAQSLKQVSCTGTSMGAIGCAFGLHMTNPQYSSLWMGQPLFRWDLFDTGAWPGEIWTSADPLKATIGTAPQTLGTTASAILNDDGTSWQDYVNLPALVQASPGDDLPFVGWMQTKNDVNYRSGEGGYIQNLRMVEALRNPGGTGLCRGFSWIWFMGQHETSFPAMGTINADWGSSPISGVAYNKSSFRRDRMYPATCNSSLDDDPGTGTADPTTGIQPGDPVGGLNVGFVWTVYTDSSSTLDLDIGNTWMTRSATPIISTTLASPMLTTDGSFTVTDASSFLAISTNPYFLVGSGSTVEIMYGNTKSSNTITLIGRSAGKLGTSVSGSTWSAGTPVRQFVTQPTGPNQGPQTSITTDVAMRQLQGFIKANGATISCNVTPFGESAVVKTGTVIGSHGAFPLTGVKINATGRTRIVCS